MADYVYTTTVLKAFEILQCFDDGGRELGIKELSERVGMPPSTLHHIVNSLEYIGLLYQNNDTKKYRPGPRHLEMVRRSGRIEEYQRIAMKHMKALRQLVDENVNLAMDYGEDVVLLHREECSHMLRPTFPLYTPFKSYQTGLGLVILTEKTEAALRWIYDRNAADIGMTREAFLASIERVRQDGYAFDDQVFCSGLRCVAAPVRGPGGGILFSISISAPVNRMSDETCRTLARQVIKYTDMASEEIQALG